MGLTRQRSRVRGSPLRTVEGEGEGPGPVLLDRELCLIWANDVFSRRFGDEVELIGKPLTEILSPREGETASFEKTLRASAIESSGIFVVLVTDITEYNRLFEKLVRTKKLEAIGQLAASVGHELRNPLGVIKNTCYYLTMKLRDVANEKVMRHLEILDREVDSANENHRRLIGLLEGEAARSQRGRCQQDRR